MTEHYDFAERWREAQGFDASREVLRDAAHDIIHSKSLEDLSMRGLAARVGASAMAAYRYYPGKDALIEEIRLHISRRFAMALQEAAAQPSDPVGRFRKMCAVYVDFAVSNEQDYRLMFGNAVNSAQIVVGADQRAPAWHGLLQALEGLYYPDRPANMVDKAHLVWGSLHGIVMLHLCNRLNFGRSIQELAEPLFTFLVAGLCVPVVAEPTPGSAASETLPCGRHHTAVGEYSSQLANDPPTRQRGVDDAGQAFPAVVVDDVEHTNRRPQANVSDTKSRDQR
jgi:AcrR family transcriptional regulator